MNNAPIKFGLALLTVFLTVFLVLTYFGFF